MKIFSNLHKCRYKQYACVLIVTMLQACVAMIALWLSPVLPQLTSQESPIENKLNDVEVAWLISAKDLGAVIGCLLSAWLTGKIGRKTVLLMAALPLIISWIMAAFTKVTVVLIISQIIAGIGVGITYVALPIYIGEIAEKDIRGRMAIFQSVLSSLGTVYVLVVGPFVSYFVLTLTCSVFPVLYAILFSFMPETPYYFVKAGKNKNATDSLCQLASKDKNLDDINELLLEVKESVAYDMQNKVMPWNLIVNRSYRKALLICFALKSIAVLSGKFVMNSYLQKIIELSGSTISPEISSIIFGIIQVPSTLLAAVLVDKVGRKPLLVVSSAGCALTMIGQGVYFYLYDETKTDLSNVSWLPTASLALYLLFITFGIMILPGVLMSEIFTINIKSIAIAFLSIYGSGLGILVSQLFPPVVNSWGLYTAFWIFATTCTLGALFGLFGLPETKGKSFLQIQSMLNNNNGTDENINIMCNTEIK